MKGAKKTNVSARMLLDMVDEQRIVYNWQHIARKLKQNRFNPLRRRLVLAAALVLIIMGAVSAIYFSKDTVTVSPPLSFELSESTPMITVPSTAPDDRRIPLSDGSTITLAPGASLEVKDNDPTRFLTLLHRGWVRYNIIPGHTRTWEVDTRLCRIIVLGTQFTVNRTPSSVHIAVHRGTVAVYPPTGDQILATLTAGKTYTLRVPRLHVPSHLAPRPPFADKTDAHSPEPEFVRDRRKKHTGADEPGSNHDARPHTQITRLAGLGASDDVNALLNKVDEARLRNMPQKATTLLERILREHPDDPAVSLAALTLGKIRLDTLHRPREAALAFKQAATSKRLPTPLREQAYARCVEAFRRAGDVASAQKMSELYRRRFPNGKWIPWIERWSKSE